MHINKKGDGLNQNVYLGSQQNGGFATQTYGISLYSRSSRFETPLKSPFGPYLISKTLTEKTTLEFAEEHGLDLVTVIPSFIVGPFICPKFPGSVHTAMSMILGKFQNLNLVDG